VHHAGFCFERQNAGFVSKDRKRSWRSVVVLAGCINSTSAYVWYSLVHADALRAVDSLNILAD
jgi:hypothetical protein